MKLSELVITILWLAAMMPLSADNILLNPSFEEAGTTTKPAPPWEVQRCDTQQVLNGKRAARLVSSDGKKSVRLQQHSLGPRLRMLKAGTEIEFSAWVYSTGKKARCMIYFESIPDKFAVTSQIRSVPADVWTRMRLRFKLPGKTLGLPKIGIVLYGDGDLRIDDAYVGAAAQAPSQPHGRSLISNQAVDKGVAYFSMDVLENNLLGDSALKNWTPSATPSQQAIITDHAGTPVFLLSADGKPQNELSWCYRSDAKSFAGLAAGTGLRFTLPVSTGGDPSTCFKATVELFKEKKCIGSFTLGQDTVYVGWENKSFNFRLPEAVPDEVAVTVCLLSPGILRFQVPTLTINAPNTSSGVYNKYYARIADLPPCRTYILPEHPVKLSMEAVLPSGTLNVTLSEIDGVALKHWKLNGLPSYTFVRRSIELPELPAGAYKLTFKGGDGNEAILDTELFRIRSPQTKGAAFTADHYMTLNRKPFFPVGLTHVPVYKPDFFRVYAESGINTICVRQLGENILFSNYLNTVFQQNKLASIYWNNLSFIFSSADELRRSVMTMNKNFKEIPGFIGFLDDESCWNKASLSRVRRNAEFFFKYLPDYLLWENHAPRISFAPDAKFNYRFSHMRRFTQPFDVTGTDIYPVPAPQIRHNNLSNRLLSCVGNYTEMAHCIGWGEKPVWMILQGFGWGEQGGRKLLSTMPRPNYKELRFMVYDAIVHGATGIFWHSEGGAKGHGPCDEVYSDYWREFAKVNRELNRIGTLLAGSHAVKIKPLPVPVRAVVRENNGMKIFIAVNESERSAPVFRFPLKGDFFSSPDGKPLVDKMIKLPPYGVAIYTSTPVKTESPLRFTPKTVTHQPGIPIEGSVKLHADWICHPAQQNSTNSQCVFRNTFLLDKVPEQARFRVSADDSWRVWINGRELPDRGSNSCIVYEYDVTEYLNTGTNTVRAILYNKTGRTALAFELQAGSRTLTASSGRTECSANGRTDWQPAHVLGPHAETAPWKKPRCLISDCR